MVRFVEKGESHHLPVALASIYSKYLRELVMRCFNRYWATHVAGLRPTGGYYADGQRFLADIEPALRAQNVERERLVRCV
jgi:ribonuclease HII